MSIYTSVGERIMRVVGYFILGLPDGCDESEHRSFGFFMNW